MIIYLHDFGNNGVGSKVTQLKTKFGDNNVLAPNLPVDPDEVVPVVRPIARNFILNKPQGDKLVFVGVGMGGLYASFFSNYYNAPAILVNPWVNPINLMRSKLGNNTNSDGVTFSFEEVHLERLDKMEKYAYQLHNTGLINLFVAEDNTLLPTQVMLDQFPNYDYRNVTTNGGDNFDSNWNLVIAQLEKILS